MLISIVGNFHFEQRGDALFIGSEESAALICNGHARLVPPEPTFLRFSRARLAPLAMAWTLNETPKVAQGACESAQGH
ncbi:hypothetical protein [Acidovorax sp. M2(2025)]|uniref:hypothetical protein n=1 Tax=Acidovorax sp. M2(2025) TaxID=3411355 RepID=UPI003BF5F86F